MNPLKALLRSDTAKRKVQSAFKTAGSTLTTAWSDKRKVRKIYCAVLLHASLGEGSGVSLRTYLGFGGCLETLPLSPIHHSD